MTVLIFPPASTRTRPRIGYDNLFRAAGVTLTTDEETAGYEMEHIADALPFTYWMPLTDGEHYVQAVLPMAKTVNYFAFYSQDAYLNGATIELRYSQDAGATWPVAATSAPSSNAPIYMTFNPIQAARWRVVVTGPVSKLGVVFAGEDLVLERGMWVGFSPPQLSMDDELTTNLSESGTYLGRSLIKRGNKIALVLDMLTPQWVRDHWYPFMVASKTRPFFVKWNEADFPSEVIFAWLDDAGDMQDPQYSKIKYMSAGFKAKGRVD